MSDPPNPPMDDSGYPITELSLARRLEGTEAAANVAFVEAFGRLMAHAEGVHCSLAQIEGKPVAIGARSLAGETALLAGASTIPSARGLGARLAPLAARLEYASGRGADPAMVVAQPGSASQRNAERRGFRTAYARTRWRLGAPNPDRRSSTR